MKSLLKKIIVFLIQLEAKAVLKKYKPKIIAITGSVGKTTTKDMIYTVVSSAYYARKSQKSFNSEIGIPLTILGCDNAWNNILKWSKNILEGLKLLIFKNHYPKWLILEVGADNPGDIKKITNWLNPDIVVLTKIPETPVHIEFFPSVEDLFREKMYLAEAVKKEGSVILNGDDKKLSSIEKLDGVKYIKYGLKEENDFKAEEYFIHYDEKMMPSGISFKLSYLGSNIPIRIESILGEPFIYSALAAMAVGVNCDINIIQISKALQNHKTLPGRMKIVEGKNKSVLIDDSYNSSPEAVKKALEALEKVESKGRKIAILGDMLELGKHSSDAHKNIGKNIGKKIDKLITIGIRSENTAEEAKNTGMKNENILKFETSSDAVDELKKLPQEGDIVLIKGSQSIRMEKITENLMNNPEMKQELLPRQEEEWIKR